MAVNSNAKAAPAPKNGIILSSKNLEEIEAYLQELPYKYSSGLMNYFGILFQTQNPGAPVRVPLVKKTIAKKAVAKKKSK